MVTDVRYGHVYNDLCARLYSRCDFWLNNVLQTAAGSTVLVGAATVFFGNDKGVVPSKITAASGAVLSFLSLVGMFWGAAVRAERHRAASAAFLELFGRAWDIPTSELSRELVSAQNNAPPGPRGLEMPAFSRNIAFFGYPPERLTPWERFLNLLA